MNSIIKKKGISTIGNLRRFIQDTTGCSRKRAKEVASQYAPKVPNTTFSCDLKKYDDAIPIQREYNDFAVTHSIIGKHSPKQNLMLIKNFLNNAAAEEAYFAKKIAKRGQPVG